MNKNLNNNRKRVSFGKRLMTRPFVFLFPCVMIFSAGKVMGEIVKYDSIAADGIYIQNYETVSDEEWNLILVNPWNELPENFYVERAVLSSGHSIDKRAYSDLIEMLEDAKAEGLSLVICSSYRTMEKQQRLYENEVNDYVSLGYSYEEAKKEAAKWVARPGTSEHQTGLALDIVSASFQSLTKEQENTKEQKWLMENSYKYGFILRYPEDKTEITGINYEPWHYRYVGKEAAKVIFEEKISLEEYIADYINID